MALQGEQNGSMEKLFKWISPLKHRLNTVPLSTIHAMPRQCHQFRKQWRPHKSSSSQHTSQLSHNECKTETLKLKHQLPMLRFMFILKCQNLLEA